MSEYLPLESLKMFAGNIRIQSGPDVAQTCFRDEGCFFFFSELHLIKKYQFDFPFEVLLHSSSSSDPKFNTLTTSNKWGREGAKSSNIQSSTSL